VPIARDHRLDPQKVFVRAGLLLCGVALTWTCAAFGLLAANMLVAGEGCHSHSQFKPALRQVRTIKYAVARYQIDHDRCPATRDELIANGYVDRKRFDDPWGKPITFTCDTDNVRVTSSGPDRVSGTADDVSDEF
jgi:hypothetical protein